MTDIKHGEIGGRGRDSDDDKKTLQGGSGQSGQSGVNISEPQPQQSAKKIKNRKSQRKPKPPPFLVCPVKVK
jgi:hypothetical protein